MRLFDHHNLAALDDGEPAAPLLTRKAVLSAETTDTLPRCKLCGFHKVVNGECLVCKHTKRQARRVETFRRRNPWSNRRAAS